MTQFKIFTETWPSTCSSPIETMDYIEHYNDLIQEKINKWCLENDPYTINFVIQSVDVNYDKHMITVIVVYEYM